VSAIEHLFTPELLQSALRLRYEGGAWEAISKQLDVPCDGLRRRLEPRYAAKRNRQILDAIDRRRTYGEMTAERISAEEAARIIAAVPSDSRSRVAKWLGDPPAGRSALDIKKRTIAGQSGQAGGEKRLILHLNNYGALSETAPQIPQAVH
jgi:hypothetical protein